MDLSDHLITVVCDGCGNKTVFPMNAPATFACQSCGSSHGVVTLFEKEDNGMMRFICARCEEDFFLFRGTPALLNCPKCGYQVIIPNSEIILSKVTREFLPLTNVRDVRLGSIADFSSNTRIKVAIPYYDGGERIDRAARTWITPEVVWIITDEETIPPGWGVCHQIFTPKNARDEKLHPSKTKPFLIDMMKRMVEKFPNEEYYGFFNSDIILPLGASVKHLIPSKGKKIVFYHRKDLIQTKRNTQIREFEKGCLIICGKDGFVADKETTKFIIENMPDLIIGAPVWDDGLVMWCWKNLGKPNVELRYGDIWHALHSTDWTPYDSDATFNASQVEASGIPRPDWYAVKWDKEQDDAQRKISKNAKKKVLGIIQPGRIGDIIIVLPIAKWFYEMGFQVIWPVCTEFLPLFDNYINYVKVLEIYGGLGNSYRSSIEILQQYKVDQIVDLGIGFGRDEKGWISSKLNFNEWKYKEAGVPFKERFNLQINRDFKKEFILLESAKETHKLNGNKFSVIHDEGTKGPFKFDKDGVRIAPKEGFTVWDWIGVIENANHLYFVDSCFANLADQLKLCVGKRTVWFWKDIPDVEPRKSLGFPKLCRDWKVV